MDGLDFARAVTFGLSVTVTSAVLRKWFPEASFNAQTEQRAPLQPPDWVYGLVWPLLYVCVGAAWVLTDRLVRTDILFLAISLLCCAWLPVYLLAKNYTASTLILVACVGVAVGTVAVSSDPFKWLLTPFVCWLSFAAYLNGYRARSGQ